MHPRRSITRLVLSLVLPITMTGCSTMDSKVEEGKVESDSTMSPVLDNAWARAPLVHAGESTHGKSFKPEWQHYRLPGKSASDYSFARLDGRDAMAVTAQSSASLLRHDVRIAPDDLAKLRFSWKVPELIKMADLAHRDNADSPVRIVLVFEGDRSKFSAKNAMLSELAHAISGEPLPYATMMYVWCNTREAGSVIHSARTDRIRKIVVESGATNLNKWLDYDRDIRADFTKAFGETPGALVGIGIMTDSDNTRTRTRAWYGGIRLAGR